MRLNKLTYCLLPAFALFSLMIATSCAGQITNTPIFKSYGLETEADNVIQNDEHLYEFFESLYLQRKQNDRVISIVHIGDSHIQGDYLTAYVRRGLQNEFGNAGRGMVSPARIAGSNDAFNMIIRSKDIWESKKIIQHELPLPIGIDGITIKTTEPQRKLNVYVNDLWSDFSFDRIKIFYQKDDASFKLAVRDTSANELGVIDPTLPEQFKNISQIKLQQPTTAIVLETQRTSPEQNQFTLFGLSLENSKNGVIYHAIGVNGAKYAHYNAATLFAEQSAVLAPQLFIVSLGTNEAISYPYMDKKLEQHIDELVSRLKSFNPDVHFILVTPPDAYMKKNKMNPGVQMVRKTIVQYAVENGLAFYDMYKACGGENSADKWRKEGLLRSDGVHFTKEGYAYQGNLFFSAIMKSYNQYVPLRHP